MTQNNLGLQGRQLTTLDELDEEETDPEEPSNEMTVKTKGQEQAAAPISLNPAEIQMVIAIMSS